MRKIKELAAIGFILDKDFRGGKIDEEISDDKEDAYDQGFEDAKMDILQFLKQRGLLLVDASDYGREMRP